MLTRARIRGFTLVEALVAIAIMGLGLVGSAALLLKTIQQERESGSRRAALRLAASMADQLRAIRRPDGHAALAITGVDPVVACAGHPASCDAERTAESLRITWVTEVVSVLPQGAGAIVGVADPLVPEYLIAIDWPAVGSGVERLRVPVTT